MATRGEARAALLYLTAALGLATAGRAADVTIGDPAPKLAVGEFIKGEPVREFAHGTIYVIEFWATWCGPCRQSIPHLTELAHKYKDVVFIGANVWERDANAPRPFVAEMGDKMDYRVALDDAGKMAKTWMEAAGQDGIPCAFVVNGDAKVAWIGHPMAMDPVLAKVVAGTWDLKAAREKAEAEAKREAAKRVVMEQLEQAANDPKAMAKILKDWFAKDPGAEEEFGAQLFVFLSVYDQDGAAAYGLKLADGLLKEDPGQLNGMAWWVADPESRITVQPTAALAKAAVELALRADALTKHEDAAILATLGMAYALVENWPKALEALELAVKLTDDRDAKEGIQDHLSRVRRSAEGH
ncbi:MAG: redoxin family protein [Armatimonadetes bacterium]|nr:redoxin family protein [Armatimonadota bacterium]